MTSLLDKLNLRPAERRLVVVVALVVIAALYAFFIWPQFAAWKKLNQRKGDLEMALQRFQKEIARTTEYKKDLVALKEKGTPVDAEAQALDMVRYVNSQAAIAGVTISSYTTAKGASTSGGKTNAFFEEQTGNIQFVAEETALVNFLFALGSGNSLIRVSSMTLSPDPARLKLMGSMTLVTSYPKKAAAKAAAATTPAPGTKPITPAGPKTPGSTAPKSISAALSGSAKPGATNAAPATNWWGTVKGWFSSSPASPATNASVKATNTTDKPAPAPTKKS